MTRRFQDRQWTFAGGHASLPILLLLLYTMDRQISILALAIIGSLWSILLGVLQGSGYFERHVKGCTWLVLVVDSLLLYMMFTWPAWHGLKPTWLFLFLIPFYASEYGVKVTTIFGVICTLNLYFFSAAQHVSFFSMDTLFDLLATVVFVFFVGRVTDHLKYLAYHDPLTGVYSREYLMNTLHRLHQHGQQNEKRAILLFDLDQFKYVNDTMGHAAGDQLLKDVAVKVKSILPKTSTLARMGGDEFVVLVPSEYAHVVQNVADNVLKSLRQPFRIRELEIYVSASLGLVVDETNTNPIALIRNADRAMYEVKRRGGNSYRLYEPGIMQTTDYLKTVAALHHALEHNEFVVYFQPIIHVASGKIVALESLLRWNQPLRGIVPPKDFIPIAEETGLIIPIGEVVLRHVCRRIKQWEQSGYLPLRVSVNISGRQFQQPDFVSMVERMIHETGIVPSLLELEITESVAIMDTERTKQVFRDIRVLGVHISIDDFGTGYSSLSYLRHLPVCALKIDQAFVREISKESAHSPITTAVIDLAHALNLRVVAEGVETSEQLEFLRHSACDEVQGYLLSRPLPPDDLETLLKKELTAGREE